MFGRRYNGTFSVRIDDLERRLYVHLESGAKHTDLRDEARADAERFLSGLATNKYFDGVIYLDVKKTERRTPVAGFLKGAGDSRSRKTSIDLRVVSQAMLSSST